jgi:hypothetical protein
VHQAAQDDAAGDRLVAPLPGVKVSPRWVAALLGGFSLAVVADA